MKPVRDRHGTILNAALLRADQVVHMVVLCPACGEKVFVKWPEGWDGHAGHKCAGLEGSDPDKRKTEFKASLRHLFK